VMARKVLIITSCFPPVPRIGSLRYEGLAKYLPEFGWEPIILTKVLPGRPDQRFKVKEVSYPGNFFKRLKSMAHVAQNDDLQAPLSKSITSVENKKSLRDRFDGFIWHLILFPNRYRGLCRYFIRAGREILQRENIDVIISSSRIMHVAAKELKVEWQVPWIADFRDLWTQNHYYTGGPIVKWIERKLEVKTLSQADALVTVSKPLAEKLHSLHKKNLVFAIPNGFDPTEIGQAPLTKYFTITYAGSLYAGKRDPCPLFRAVQEMITDGVAKPSSVRIRFFGPRQHWLEQEIKRHKLEGLVEQYGVVPRDIVLTKERESQLLLLLNWSDPNECGVYTGKVFEYLAAKRPILAVGGPRGVVSELMEETNAGIHVSDLPSLKRALINYYKEYKTTGKVSYLGKEEQIHKYSHYEMARKFAKVLDQIKK